jgi:ribosomal-protein-alanine N-acetyltransferase
MPVSIPRSEALDFSLASENHFAWFRDLYSNPEVMQNIPGGAMTNEKAIQTALRAIKTDGNGGLGYWVANMKGSSAPIGYVVLRPFDWDSKFEGTEIGYIIDKTYWGKGIASQAVAAVMDFALRDLKQIRLLALVNDENRASIKIVERLGFIRSIVRPEKYPDNSVWIKEV